MDDVVCGGVKVCLASTWSSAADFMMIYIQEAHASDEWPIYQLDEDIPQHTTLSARMAVAQKFYRDFCADSNLQMYVDSMDNSFNTALSSWPFRFWVIEKRQDGPCIGFKAMPRGSAYHLSDLHSYLLSVTSS